MIVHIVGNRPQFIKLSPLYNEFNKRGYHQMIIHSGQHYDKNMSEVFFEELGIPTPDMNLMSGSGTHAEMTARIMVGLEKALMEKTPDLVIIYGDTNTTLAAAVVTSKLNIPVAHVEGGDRVGIRSNPEEGNRIVSDHLSDIIFCSDKDAMECAAKEGLSDRAFLSGDIMYDTFLSVEKKAEVSSEDNKESIVLMTWHRQENTCSKERMDSILEFLKRLEDKIVCPLHPRTVKMLKEYDLWDKAQSIRNLNIIDPVGYIEMVELMGRARLILTDSGGLSKESSFAGAKCLFMWNGLVWPDLIRCDWIHRFDPEDRDSVEEAAVFAQKAVKVAREERPMFYGDGHAAAKMADILADKGMLR